MSHYNVTVEVPEQVDEFVPLIWDGVSGIFSGTLLS